MPVGGPASRLLAELALNGVDQLLRSEGIRFCRYVDDYRLFCNSQEEAFQILIFLSEKLFNEKLALQKNKTRILLSKEFCDEANLLLRKGQQSEKDLTEEDKLVRLSLRFDPYSETRVDDYKALQAQVANVDIAGILGRELEKTRIEPTIVKQAISALRVLDPIPRCEMLRIVLRRENLDALAPVLPKLMTVLRGLYDELDTSTQDLIDMALIDLISSGSHLAKIKLNLSYILQVLRLRGTQQKELLFTKVFKDNSSALVRREIILAMASWNGRYWISDLKKNFAHGLSSWERRCFILASYTLGDEGKHWRTHTKDSFAPLETIVREWHSSKVRSNQVTPW